jgi:signal peptidase II
MKPFLRNMEKKAFAWWRIHAWEVMVVLGLLLLDRATKVLAQRFLEQGAISVFPFFQLNYVQNTGAAFGMMQGGNGLLIGVMLAIIGYLAYSWKDLCSQGKLVHWGCLLILAGALGNLYDRITLGYVVDFLDFLVWPVFNVADSAITVGGCLFVLSLLCKGLGKREAK